MKKLLLITSVLLALGLVAGCSNDDETVVTPTPPTGPMNPGGTIGVFADAAGTNATVTDPGAGQLVTVYVVHKSGLGVLSSQFRVEAPAGWTYVGSSSPFPVKIDNPSYNGGFEGGTSVTYGGCMTGSTHVATVQYLAPGGSAGAVFRVLPNNQFQYINAVECDLTLVNSVIGEECTVN